MASSQLGYGAGRASGSGSLPRSNAVPLSIPRGPGPQGTKSERSSFSEGVREPADAEPRGSLSSRYHSPRAGRFSSDAGGGSFGVEGASPLGALLRRPKDRRRSGASQSPVSHSGFTVRTEGFDTGGSAFPPAGPPAQQRQQQAQQQPLEQQQQQQQQPAASPPKPQGLLSRTFSATAPSAEALKEKLESCLESKPSIEQGLDGEAVSTLRQLQAQHPVFGAATVTSAFNIANFCYTGPAHGGAVMAQSVATACILAELGADETCIAAALLKDILPRSMMAEGQLRGLVPLEIADLVVRVGRLDDICQVRQDMVEAAAGAPLNAEASQRISHLLLTLADVRGVLIQLAASLAGLRAAESGPEKEKSAREALEVFAPIANRLGVWSIKAALEDAAFQVLHPGEHRELQAKLRESQDRGTIERALDSLAGVLTQRGLEGADLSGRPKNLYGVMRKMRDKGKGLAQVYDVRALRVVVKSKADCYAVLQEVHRLWPEVPGRYKDYVRTPKPNGYQSLHTVVQLPDGRPMEIQIRTDKMHFIAEYGVAAHWRYKERLGGGGGGEAGPGARSAAEEQQVNWARWLINWTLDLKDAKLRPSGSPPQDSALASLAGKICAFPTHRPGCKFAEFASRHAPKPVSAEELAEAPVLVVCLDHAKQAGPGAATSIEELPPRCTVGQLPRLLGVPPGTHILVNMAEADDPLQVLAHGDRVEILAPSAESGAIPQRLTQEQLEVQRQRLQRLFGKSPQAQWQASPPDARRLAANAALN